LLVQAHAAHIAIEASKGKTETARTGAIVPPSGPARPGQARGDV